MKVVEPIEYISIDDLFQIVERIVENGMIKVKRKIVKKKKIESDNVKVETSTTSSTSSVFGKFLGGHSKTTLTIFAPILTTYLPLVDIFT